MRRWIPAVLLGVALGLVPGSSAADGLMATVRVQIGSAVLGETGGTIPANTVFVVDQTTTIAGRRGTECGGVALLTFHFPPDASGFVEAPDQYLLIEQFPPARVRDENGEEQLNPARLASPRVSTAAAVFRSGSPGSYEIEVNVLVLCADADQQFIRQSYPIEVR